MKKLILSTLLITLTSTAFANSYEKWCDDAIRDLVKKSFFVGLQDNPEDFTELIHMKMDKVKSACKKYGEKSSERARAFDSFR